MSEADQRVLKPDDEDDEDSDDIDIDNRERNADWLLQDEKFT